MGRVEDCDKIEVRQNIFKSCKKNSVCWGPENISVEENCIIAGSGTYIHKGLFRGSKKASGRQMLDSYQKT